MSRALTGELFWDVVKCGVPRCRNRQVGAQDSNFTMVDGTYKGLVTGGYKPANIKFGDPTLQAFMGCCIR